VSIYISIFWSFLKVGIFGYGGGPAFIPLIEKEVVYNYGWMTSTEFADALAMSNTLPGPVSTKMAIIIGLKTAGTWGAVAAIGALLLPSSIFIVILATLYFKYRHVPSVRGLLHCVRPVVVALLMVTVAHLAPKSVASWYTFLIGLVAFIVVYYFKIHPLFAVLAAGLIGYFFVG
jgi:chromate transporter